MIPDGNYMKRVTIKYSVDSIEIVIIIADMLASQKKVPLIHSDL